MKALFSAVVILLLLSGHAGAVSLSDDRTGEVLIYPYYSTRGMDTVISVTNGSARPKALKVVMREAKQGREVLLFNLYIPAGDSWSALLGSQPDGSRPFVSVADPTCTVPSFFVQNDSNLPNGAPTVTLRTFLIDDDPDVEQRIGEGFVEIFEMGEVVDGAAVLTNGRACGSLTRAWLPPDGFWSIDTSLGMSPPTGGLEGSAMLVDAVSGTTYEYDAVALKNFSDRQLHSEPGSLGPPELNDANRGQVPRSVLSTVATDEGSIDLLWASGVEAVSAALSQASLAASYTISPAMDQTADLILTLPTRRYFEDAQFAPVDQAVPGAPFVSTYSNEEGAPTQVPVQLTDSIGDTLISCGDATVNLPWTVQVLSLSAEPVLESFFQVGMDLDTDSGGRLVLGLGESRRTGCSGPFRFADARVVNGPNQGLVAGLGGLPVIGLKLERTRAGILGTARGRQILQATGTVSPMAGETDLSLE